MLGETEFMGGRTSALKTHVVSSDDPPNSLEIK